MTQVPETPKAPVPPEPPEPARRPATRPSRAARLRDRLGLRRPRRRPGPGSPSAPPPAPAGATAASGRRRRPRPLHLFRFLRFVRFVRIFRIFRFLRFLRIFRPARLFRLFRRIRQRLVHSLWTVPRSAVARWAAAAVRPVRSGYRAADRGVRALPWHRLVRLCRGTAALTRTALLRTGLLRPDPDGDTARTRQDRLAPRSRRMEVAAVASAVLVTVLTAAILPAEDSVPATAAPGAGLPERPGTGTGAGAGAGGLAPMPRSAPTQVRIPELGIAVEAFGADLAPDGGPPTPAEEDAMRAAWYAGGVAPGEAGAALLVGHLDTATGPAAFAGLGSLEPGGVIEVDRADGTTAVFVADAVEQYLKSQFPDDKVYGSVDTPELRLITCGGTWSPDGGYNANIVVYAHLTATHPTASG
ncbi:class F sortase [Streptomyces aidingensis]|uniref:Sortase family protein n=1 Tax=Streptomyces aidingensis TaxID=910347 RepID=A0A1I1Q1C3_9ACTN|nr:class F sortase [Streptomyces aidingensis]SFD15757.1 Sortase family protein [Streptomyces aidingensis]